MVFHRGCLPTCEFHFDQVVLQRVNEFKYLGVTLSSQLSFSSHIREVSLRARSRLGMLGGTLGLHKMSLDLALQIFRIYILPIVEYASSVWINRKRSTEAVKFFNATFTKFLKRYLGVPTSSDNEITHHICETRPLFEIVQERSHNNFLSIIQPQSVPEIDFVAPTVELFEPFRTISSGFWMSRQLVSVPQNPYFRKKILRDIFDSSHYLNCSDNKYHLLPMETCICTYCGKPNHFYHASKFCENLN